MPSMESSDASRLRRGGAPRYISLNQVILNLVLAMPDPSPAKSEKSGDEFQTGALA